MLEDQQKRNLYEQQEQNNPQQKQNQEQFKNKQNQDPNSMSHLMPFIIQKYTKQDRQKQRSSRPKLGLRRLTDDKKIISIEIDIPYDQNTIIRQKFDWDLNKDKISPSDFSKELVTALNLPFEYIDKIREQILGQIMQHIKNNTKQKIIMHQAFLQNLQQQQLQQQQNQQLNSLQDGINSMSLNNSNNNLKSFQNIRFNNTQYLQAPHAQQQQYSRQQNEKKKMSRMRRKQLQRTTMMTNNNQPHRYFKQKKLCKNCKNQNVTPGFQCKNCKVPFELLQALNMDDKRIKISVKYYQKIANKIPLLVYEAKKRHFQKQDFDSFYRIYNKIKNIFQSCDQLSKQNLNQMKYIMQKYHENFLNGQLDFNDQDIIYEKETKKDIKQDQNRPKRQRGRPRKIKIINQEIEIEPGNSQQDGSQEESSSQYQYYQSS